CLCDSSCFADSAIADSQQGNEQNKSEQTSYFSFGDILIALVPHLKSPFGVVLGSDKPPIAEVPDEIVNEFRAVLTGRAAREIDMFKSPPDRCVHYEIQ